MVTFLGLSNIGLPIDVGAEHTEQQNRRHAQASQRFGRQFQQRRTMGERLIIAGWTVIDAIAPDARVDACIQFGAQE